MSYAKLRCVGSSLHLKTKFGDGYKVEVTCDEGGAEAAQAFVRSLLPAEAAVISQVGGTHFVFQSPTTSTELSKLFAAMEARPPSARIKDWAMRQTSMEEVFLHVATRAEEATSSTAPSAKKGVEKTAVARVESAATESATDMDDVPSLSLATAGVAA
jgi:hypothetical protein